MAIPARTIHPIWTATITRSVCIARSASIFPNPYISFTFLCLRSTKLNLGIRATVSDSTLANLADRHLKAVIGNAKERYIARTNQHTHWSGKSDFRNLSTLVRNQPANMPFPPTIGFEHNVVAPPSKYGNVKHEAQPADSLRNTVAMRHCLAIQVFGFIFRQVLHIPSVRFLRTLTKRARHKIHDRHHQQVADACDQTNTTDVHDLIHSHSPF